MKILYLDQFIVSDLADSQTEELKNLKNLLEELVTLKKVICPLSLEHYLESSTRSDEEALRNDQLMNRLSGGLCFHPEFSITTSLINALIKDKPFEQEMFLEKAVKDIFNDKSKIQRFRETNQKFRDSRGYLLNDVNDIRKITRGDKIKKPTESPLFKVLVKMPSISFTERMEELFTKGQIAIRGDQTPVGEIPNWIDVILEYLIRHFQISEFELLKLYIELKEKGFNNIPTLDILSNLNALQCVLYKKMSPNDDVDNLRIACGLQVSDILFTDKRRKAEIEQLGLNRKYRCIILTGTVEDLRYFKEFLINLRNT